MIAAEKVQVLQHFLAALPPPLASRLAKAVEVDRLSGGRGLPHELILDGLRPVLRQNTSQRIPTPRRLFCRPFQDLFVDRARNEKTRGGISRQSIVPVWTWLEQTLLPEATAAFARDCRAALLSFNEPAALERVSEFWLAAAAAISTSLTDNAGRARAKAQLGGEAVLADAQEMAILLMAGPEIVELQDLLPRPVPVLSDPLLVSLREVYQRIAAKAPDAAPYMAVIVMYRLARRWEALRLPVFVARQTSDTLISSTDMGLVGEVLFGEMDEHLRVIRAARHPDFDAGALIHAVAGFAELSMGLVKEVEMRRDGKWGQRLVGARAAAAESLEALIERAAKEILAALPTHRSGYTGGPVTPDLAKAPDAGRCERARRYTTLLTGCRPFAAAVSAAAAIKGAERDIVTALRGYNDELLRELRGAEGARRAHGEEFLDIAAEFTGRLIGNEEGEILRRRGRAALAPAAAA